MEKPRTVADQLHERFKAQAELCRELGDSSLREIDLVLAEQGEFWTEHRDLIEQNAIEPDE